jgi:FkbM family methyltransferase
MRRIADTAYRSPIAHHLGRYLPEGFKNRLRRYRFGQLQNLLYILAESVREVRLEGNLLLVELADGTTFYGQADEEVHPAFISADPRRLGKIGSFLRFGSLLGSLCIQYVEHVYERYYKLKKGEVVVDLGAHIGTFTVAAAKAVGHEGVIIAVEPSASSLWLLRKNIEANGLSNVVVIPMGIWSAKASLNLYLSKDHAAYSFFGGTNDFEQVQVDTLDNILARVGVDRVDFIKMDIEGAEIEAIKGMEEALRKNDVNLAISSYHIVDGEKTYKRVISQLRGRGFGTTLHPGSEGEIVYASKKMG